MKNITYISASAGSGKTYTLTKRLAEMILQGQVRANEVILTTFTNQAAAELKEKAQSELYAQGLHEAAAQLDEAMIGTVHGVANAFINKYWFYLGLSPQMCVLAEEDVAFYLNQSLAGLPEPEEMDFFHKFRTEF
ncbi:MAG: UvrD-helicase domain-containing protein, partial [Elusimicrobiales bacterium]|nr:UvrD-helicase domain-containing protein [Elusimicrobiales bacterium]